MIQIKGSRYLIDLERQEHISLPIEKNLLIRFDVPNAIPFPALQLLLFPIAYCFEIAYNITKNNENENANMVFLSF